MFKIIVNERNKIATEEYEKKKARSLAPRVYERPVMMLPDMLYGDGVDNGVADSFFHKDKSTINLDSVLYDVECLKLNNSINVNIVMMQALKLETLKNQPTIKQNIQTAVRVINALNWCYSTLGKIRYRSDGRPTEPTA